MLTSGGSHYLREMRFPSDLERAFQENYYLKVRPGLRWGMILLVALHLLLAAASYHATGAVPGVMVCFAAVGLTLFALTFSPAFGRVWQPVTAALFCILAAVMLELVTHPMLVAGGPPMGAPAPAGGAAASDELSRINAAMGPGIPSIVFGFVLTRLQFRWFVPASLLVFALCIASAASGTGAPLPDVLSPAVLMVGSPLGALMFLSYVQERSARGEFLANHLLAQEREKSEQLLRNILPGPVADRLKAQPGTVAESFAEVTVLFADLVDFTSLSARLSPEGTVTLLNEVFSCFDSLAEKHSLEKIKTIGDAYMVVGGLPAPRSDHAELVAAMALDMQAAIAGFSGQAGEPLRLRIGINSGPVVAGVIGTKKFIYDLWGNTVNMAYRMESHGVAGGIQVTEATCARLRDRYRFEERHLTNVKGKGDMTAYLLLGPKADAAAGSRSLQAL
jgi:class 3 adenylate cyclase